MRRSSFKQKVIERKPVVLTPIPVEQRRGVMAPAGGAVVAVPKPVTFRSEAWRRAVASLPCVVRGKALGSNPALIDLIAAEKWNGTLPSTQVPGSALPFIGVK